MASIALGVTGSYFFGPVGGMVGSLLGSYIDSLWMNQAKDTTGPRITDRAVMSASFGEPIPRIWGAYRCAGTLIAAQNLVEHKRDTESGGKGGNSSTNTTYYYSSKFAVAFCEGPIKGINRIWADGKLIAGNGAGLYDPATGQTDQSTGVPYETKVGTYDQHMTIYLGDEAQTPDNELETFLGVGNVPAYRGICYIVFHWPSLEEFGNRIPQITAEIVVDGAQLSFDAGVIGIGADKLLGSWQFQGDGPDIYGNSYWYAVGANNPHTGSGADRVAVAYAQNGTRLFSMDGNDAADILDNHFSSTNPDASGRAFRGSSAGVFLRALAPVCAGRHVIGVLTTANRMYLSGRTAGTDDAAIFTWVLLFDPPNASGMPNLNAAWCFRDSSAGDIAAVCVSGKQSDNDKIYLIGGAGAETVVIVVPSVWELMHGAVTVALPTHAGGWGFTLGPSEMLVSRMRLIAGASGSDAQWLGTTGSSGAAVQGQGYCWFTLPSIDTNPLDQDQYSQLIDGLPVDTRLCAYFPRNVVQAARDARDIAAGGGLAGAWSPWLARMGDQYPYGFMVAWNLGPGELTMPGGPDSASGAFIDLFHGFTAVTKFDLDANSPELMAVFDAYGEGLLPFTDEFAAGTYSVNSYYPRPCLVPIGVTGGFLIFFSMAETQNPTLLTDGGGAVIDAADHVSVRAFEWNPITRQMTQIGQIEGPYVSRVHDLGETGGYVPASVWPLASGNRGAGFTWYQGNDLIYYSLGNQNKFVCAKVGALDRQGDVGLDRIVSDICRSVGLTPGQIDVAGLASQRVIGFMIGNEMAARNALQPLQQAYFFDGAEIDGRLVFRFRNGVPHGALLEDDLAARAEDAAPRTRLVETRQQDFDLPVYITFTYISQPRYFQPQSQVDQRLSRATSGKGVTSVSVPIVMTDADARASLEKLLYQAWVEREKVQITAPIKAVQFDPSDVLTITWGGGTITANVFIEDATLGADGTIEITGHFTDAIAYVPAAPPYTTTPLPEPDFPVIEAMSLAVIDGPLLRDGDDAPGYYMAACGEDAKWAGGVVYKSLDGGATYTAFVPFAAGGATMGVAATALAAAPTHLVFDAANTVTVTLKNGTLASVTKVQVLNGANRAMLGSELIGFTTATATSTPGQYVLSGLLRGCQGTEWAMGSHAPGENFTLLLRDGSVQSANASLGETGLLRELEPLSIGQQLGDATPIAFTLANNRLKPLSPCHIRGSRDTAGNLTITWVPRVRIAPDWIDGAENAVDESDENYLVEILSGSGSGATVVRSFTEAVPTAVYTAIAQASDGLTAPINVRIRQLSSRVGPGYPGVAAL